MKKLLSLLFSCVIFNVSLNAEDLFPSDTYYKDNIAVNEINTNSPSTRGDNDEPINPDDVQHGDGVWDGGNPSPIGDAVLPISLIAISYGVYLFCRNRKTMKN